MLFGRQIVARMIFFVFRRILPFVRWLVHIWVIAVLVWLLLLLLLLLVVMLLLTGNMVRIENVRNGLRGHWDGLLARHRHIAGRDPAIVAATALGTDTAVVVSVDVIVVAGLVMPVSTRVTCAGGPLRGRGGSCVPLPGQPTSSDVAGVARGISVASISGVIARHVGEIGVARVVASVPAKRATATATSCRSRRGGPSRSSCAAVAGRHVSLVRIIATAGSIRIGRHCSQSLVVDGSVCCCIREVSLRC
mmetsp:Transcript_9141/g.15662  ORF Transcript_9141/g.15662 Transcript_9141/m.15662 type:complete len:249 (+) Transcript_9141:300-1046(+)